MVRFKKGKKANMDGINLLVSILVCYPEIGTVSFEPGDEALHFSFALKEVPQRKAYESVGSFLEESMLAYHSLEGYEDARIEIFGRHADRFQRLAGLDAQGVGIAGAKEGIDLLQDAVDLGRSVVDST